MKVFLTESEFSIIQQILFVAFKNQNSDVLKNDIIHSVMDKFNLL